MRLLNLAGSIVVLPLAANAQTLDMPVVGGVPGHASSSFIPQLCFDWDEAVPFRLGCPAEPMTSEPVSGCVNINIVGNPASVVTLHGFEVVFGALPEQEAVFLLQGSLFFEISQTTIRLAPNAGPIVGVYHATTDSFHLDGFDVEIEGQINITGSTGSAGVFPASVLDLASFAFPPATGEIVMASDTQTGEPVAQLIINLGEPFTLPGGRLDVGSGFVVGLGGQPSIIAFGDSCGASECVADVNGDGMLTPTDFSAWIGAFNNNLPTCDQNGDSVCTPTDFSAWIGNYNSGC